MVWRVAGLRPIGLLAAVLVLLTSVVGPGTIPPAAEARAAGTVAAAPGPAPAPQLTTVRFGSAESISNAGVLLGRARGYFRAQGIEVETLPFQSGPNVIAPLGTGELEVGGGIVSIALFNALDRGIGVKIVADKGLSRAGFEYTQLPIRRELFDSGVVRTPADLRGRKIAVTSLRSGGEVIVNQVLSQGGATVDDAELVVLGFPDMLPALSNGAVDGAVIIEPVLSAAVARGIVTPWEAGQMNVAFGGPYQAAVLFYSDRFASQTDLARRFMIAYLQGVRAYNDAFVKNQGRAEAVRVLVENTPIKDPSLYDQMQMAGLDPDGRVARQSLQVELDFYRARGYYSGPATLDRVIDASFAEYAMQQLGPYQ
jgi:ABC-type nitrate/sulfonate/bicarbonate transport system substrate-binding protein